VGSTIDDHLDVAKMRKARKGVRERCVGFEEVNLQMHDLKGTIAFSNRA
jgi:hypothetical protein